MPSFKSRIIDALVTPLEPTQRGATEAFIAGSLTDLPQHLKIGIAVDSVLLEVLTRATHGGRIPDDEALRKLVATWESNPLTPIRQYARLLSSLVLFADQETRTDDQATEAAA
ncbi:MAG TPA: hypothetical protein VFN21_08440 [Acidimicrobiales bacterium]|nr:hypothetical protein [Acidimicrobiales bacterium]